MSESLKKNVLTGVIWQYVQKLGTQAVQFIVSIILARLLCPEDFGTIALLGVFISLSNLLIDSGFGNALIQRKNIDDIDCSSVFYLNIGVSLIIYLIVFLCAPFVASFYKIPQLTILLRVLSLQIIFMAFGCVQQSMLVREMKFNLNFYINITGAICSSITGVCMAYTGFGVWSIVSSQLVGRFCSLIGLWLLVGWRPKVQFSFIRIRELFSYGSKILVGSIIIVLYNNLYNIVIGKRYTAADLGYYNRGQLLPNTIIDAAANSVNGVLFPALSSLQNDKERHKMVIRRSERMISFVVFFLAAMMFALAPNVISLLLGEKWLPAVPFMRIVCITLSISPISVLNQSIQTTLGHSDLFLKTTMWSNIVAIVLIFTGSLVNLYVMVTAGSFAAISTLIITGSYNNRLIGYSAREHISDIAPAIILSSVTAVVVYLVTLSGINNVLTIIIGGMIGMCTYSILAYILKFEAMLFIVENAKAIYKNKLMK
ncbi:MULTISPECIES: lipopolysaccharide biosynthesis protein [Bacteroides]|uniref:lipopolysaccharide biosynthesis protein n=1 Tax=Bacteroides TaxID=816 RepID=UPI000340CCAF|nr:MULTISPECIES: lipopolysaccharide biosynthesis protein [Bacteroides]UYU46497.1 lipopolysaccharide biosynthesis protein [Bacteroides salyersiae]CCY49864.1 polysaccharide biosynthesis protein [Bacteroides sp. CAG:189]